MSTQPRILILYAHPAHQLSRTNRHLCELVSTLPNVHLHDLYETYPDFHIDVEHEQNLLSQSDLIVFQYPTQWYSTPSLLKEWIDVVLEHGWAYGHDGTALHGKDFWLVTTTGGADSSYHESGYHRRPFADFLAPLAQTIALCGMHWMTPFILHGARQADQTLIEQHAEEYRRRLANYPEWPEKTSGTWMPSPPTDCPY